MPKMIYEAKPWLLSAVGAETVVTNEFWLGVVSGALLVLTAIFIFKMRHDYRKWKNAP